MGLKKVHIGIPSELESSIYWISRKFRKNELSFKLGGADIIIQWLFYPIVSDR